MQIQKVKNMIEHQSEILSRPKREWFQTKKEKEESTGELDVFQLTLSTPNRSFPVLAKDQYNANFDGLEGPEGQVSPRLQQVSHSRLTLFRRPLGSARERLSRSRSIRLNENLPRMINPIRLTWLPQLSISARRRNSNDHRRSRTAHLSEVPPRSSRRNRNVEQNRARSQVRSVKQAPVRIRKQLHRRRHRPQLGRVPDRRGETLFP